MKYLITGLGVLVIGISLLSSKILQSNTQNTIEFKKIEDAILAGGSLHRAEAFPSEHIVPRPVDVWLPNNYSDNKTYSVLYMHDGQGLFDISKMWRKEEWKVDEWATELMEDDKIDDFIVVAIHNIPLVRWQDLYPEKALDYMNTKVRDSIMDLAKKSNFNVNLKGDEYLKFIVEELKPVIDKKFSVHTDQSHTFVMGSSMGGLMSMYAVSEYPDVFGGAACLSSHWVGVLPMPDNPHPEAIFSYMESNLPKALSHKLYFDYGDKTLDQHYPQYAPRVDEILKQKGYSELNSKNLYFKDTDHSATAWSERLNEPLLFLLGK